MKKIKKILLIVISVLTVSNLTVFADSFEAIVNVPIGLSVGVTQGLSESISPKSSPGFDSGITAQLGYLVELRAGLGLSILGELGYSFDSYRYHYSGRYNNIAEAKITQSIYTHSFQIGILPKLNIEQFAIGFGFGLKIPVSASINTKAEYSIAGFEGNTSTAEIKLDRDDIETYDRNVMPYLKFTFDYSFFFNDKMAVNVGAYLGGDFGLASKNPVNNKFYGVNSFDIGLQVGFRFAPKL